LTERHEILQKIIRSISEGDYRVVDPESTLLSSDEKMAIIQHFFRQNVQGSHAVTFDAEIVGRLLRSWFGIDPASRPTETAEAGATVSTIGRTAGQVHHCPFGKTDLFLYMTADKPELSRGFVNAVTQEAILTTEATSPPCEMVEFVPLWMRRQSAEGRFTIDPDVPSPFDTYFTRLLAIVADALGVEVECPSTEMSLIVNGDGLRYHRDRMSNQFAVLAASTGTDEDYLVQDLTLIDWDMQAGTVSGTMIEHENGDRYLLTLYPGETVGLFFAERPELPGPMMMPFHCAIPVLDRSFRSSCGMSKGKRVSSVTRGIAPASAIDRLRVTAAPLSAEMVESPLQCAYPRGVADEGAIWQESVLTPVAIIDNDEGLSIVELCSSGNRQLIAEALGDDHAETTRVLRIVKSSEGFSSLLEALPEFGTATSVIIINRADSSSQRDYPLAIDDRVQGRPWIQFPRCVARSAVRVPIAARDKLLVTPNEEIFHRSAPLDAFLTTAPLTERSPIILDVILGGPGSAKSKQEKHNG
jgi:hypothetical protein